jgi:hypothetical protein
MLAASSEALLSSEFVPGRSGLSGFSVSGLCHFLTGRAQIERRIETLVRNQDAVHPYLSARVENGVECRVDRGVAEGEARLVQGRRDGALPVMPVANSPSAALRAKAGTEAIVGR